MSLWGLHYYCYCKVCLDFSSPDRAAHTDTGTDLPCRDQPSKFHCQEEIIGVRGKQKLSGVGEKHTLDLRSVLQICFCTRVHFGKLIKSAGNNKLSPECRDLFVINTYIPQTRSFYFKDIIVASNFGVTRMGGLPWLGPSLFRCSKQRSCIAAVPQRS